MDTHDKFLFETSFEPNVLSGAAQARAAEEAEPEEPPAPTFSEEELAAAKQASFAEGKAIGEAEAERGIAQRTAEQLAQLSAKFEALSTEMNEKVDTTHRETLTAAMAVVRKLFPRLSESQAQTEIQAVVEDCLERLRDEPRLVVRAADQDLDALKLHLDGCVKRSGFNGALVFLADDRLSPGDIRVEWADGGAERDLAALWREIDAIIERTLGHETEAQGKASKAAEPQAAEEPQTPPPAAVEPLRRAKTA
ncbi:FliH/SctL family protein [Pelagibius sp.]|uniref:FliH/SctL family protein n=1 Tax=Pelagibius sp. TaxID=1931238 RepID=UPI003B50B979